VTERAPRRERGVGVLSSTFGLAFFLGFLLFATQLTLRLYTSSTLAADAYRAARLVAGDGVQRAGPAAVQAAMGSEEARLARRYGPGRLRVTWDATDATDVVLTVSLRPDGELVGGLDRILGFTTITRTARVHREVVP